MHGSDAQCDGISFFLLYPETRYLGATLLHMEEDSTKTNHLGAERIAGSTQSLVVVNRAGTSPRRDRERAQHELRNRGRRLRARALEGGPYLDLKCRRQLRETLWGRSVAANFVHMGCRRWNAHVDVVDVRLALGCGSASNQSIRPHMGRLNPWNSPYRTTVFDLQQNKRTCLSPPLLPTSR